MVGVTGIFSDLIVLIVVFTPGVLAYYLFKQYSKGVYTERETFLTAFSVFIGTTSLTVTYVLFFYYGSDVLPGEITNLLSLEFEPDPLVWLAAFLLVHYSLSIIGGAASGLVLDVVREGERSPDDAWDKFRNDHFPTIEDHQQAYMGVKTKENQEFTGRVAHVDWEGPRPGLVLDNIIDTSVDTDISGELYIPKDEISYIFEHDVDIDIDEDIDLGNFDAGIEEREQFSEGVE